MTIIKKHGNNTICRQQLKCEENNLFAMLCIVPLYTINGFVGKQHKNHNMMENSSMPSGCIRGGWLILSVRLNHTHTHIIHNWLVFLFLSSVSILCVGDLLTGHMKQAANQLHSD